MDSDTGSKSFCDFETDHYCTQATLTSKTEAGSDSGNDWGFLAPPDVTPAEVESGYKYEYFINLADASADTSGDSSGSGSGDDSAGGSAGGSTEGGDEQSPPEGGSVPFPGDEGDDGETQGSPADEPEPIPDPCDGKRDDFWDNCYEMQGVDIIKQVLTHDMP